MIKKPVHAIVTDSNFIFLAINAALVIIGYGISVYSGGASIVFMKTLKSAVLFFSIVVLFRNIKFSSRSFKSPSIIYISVFTFWTILMAFFSNEVAYSIRRSLEFLVPFIYVYLALNHLIQRYDIYMLLMNFIKAFNLVYLIPVISFLITGHGLANLNIYGEGSNQGQFFVSNHYGWASCIFILTSVDILLNTKVSFRYRLFLITFSIISLYLLLISGNRSSWVSLALSSMVFIVRLKNIRTDFKILILLLPASLIIWMAGIPDSSINARLNETETQLEKGEARFNVAQTAVEYFNENKEKWVTGAGMFNYDEVIPNTVLTDYHNSYFEILFGGGVILFLLFLHFMVFRPVYLYIRYYSKYFISITPFIIIPYFEANITGGQFLFFPWFTLLLLYNVRPRVSKAASPGIQESKIHNKLNLRKKQFIRINEDPFRFRYKT